MDNSFVYNPQLVQQALNTLQSVPSELEKDALQYQTAKDTMLATWDSSYKQEFLKANPVDLETDLKLLSQKISQFMEAVTSSANALSKLDEEAAAAIAKALK